MKSKPPSNAYSQCASLRLREPQTNYPNNFPLRASLQCNWQRYHVKNLSFKWGLKEGDIVLNLINCRVVEGTIRGVTYVDSAVPETVKSVTIKEIVLEKRTRRQWLLRGKAGGDVPLLIPVLELGVNAEIGTTRTGGAREIGLQTRTKSYVRVPGIVQAMSGEDMPMWRVSSADEESVLAGEYLDTAPLCEIEMGRESSKIVAFFCSDRGSITTKDCMYKGRRIDFADGDGRKEKILKSILSKLPQFHDIEENAGLIFCTSELSEDER